MSLQIQKHLEVTFGKVPKIVKDNAKHIIYDYTEDKFSCALCSTVIGKVNKSESSTETKLETHLQSETHLENTVPIATLLEALNETFSGKIPQLVMNNCSFLSMNDVNYTCEICEKVLGVSVNPFVVEKNFSYHLLSIAHQNNLEATRKVLKRLRDVYGGIPEIVLNNIEYITQSKSGLNYACQICKDTLRVHPNDLSKTKENFENHLHSVEHMKNTKLQKILLLIPGIDLGSIPSFLKKNVDYVIKNEENLFCFLCNENIKASQSNPYETEQNFKLHSLSSSHTQNLVFRRDPHNEVFNRLQEIFESFPEVVLKNFDFLTLWENNISCSICEEFIVGEGDASKIMENILNHVDSTQHENCISEEISRRSKVIDDLMALFGSVPIIIQDNLQYVEFLGGNNFKCLICDDKVQSEKDSDDYLNIDVDTENNFTKHFTSDKHLEQVVILENLSATLQFDVEHLFHFIPQFMLKNWDHIDYDENGQHFFCSLCQKEVFVDYGSKKEELTFQNLRNHLASEKHLAAIKKQANKELQVSEKLDSIFGRIPNYILSNIEHIYKTGDKFVCNTCGVNIDVANDVESTEINFYNHLSGAGHKSNVTGFDRDNVRALQRLRSSFSEIPEFLLKDIDFLCFCDDDLYCLLCQKCLPIDYDDLKRTKQSLRCHLGSTQHLYNMKVL